MPGIEHCDWAILSLLLATPTWCQSFHLIVSDEIISGMGVLLPAPSLSFPLDRISLLVCLEYNPFLVCWDAWYSNYQFRRHVLVLPLKCTGLYKSEPEYCLQRKKTMPYSNRIRLSTRIRWHPDSPWWPGLFCNSMSSEHAPSRN